MQTGFGVSATLKLVLRVSQVDVLTIEVPMVDDLKRLGKTEIAAGTKCQGTTLKGRRHG